ncbi:MAG: LysE family transporter [Thermoprotei archaeon]
MVLEHIINYFYGLLYGFSLAIPPGPMNALIASRSLNSYREGFFTGFGALTADLIFMFITYLAYSLVVEWDLTAFYLIGSTYMFILAYLVYESKPQMRSRDHARGVLFSYFSALFLGLTNPYQILWWVTVGLSFLSLFGLSSIIGLFTAILVWITIFPHIIRLGYSFSAKKTVYVVKAFSVIVLVIFAAILLYNALTRITTLFQFPAP